jgi:hypothetical protein
MSVKEGYYSSLNSNGTNRQNELINNIILSLLGFTVKYSVKEVKYLRAKESSIEYACKILHHDRFNRRKLSVIIISYEHEESESHNIGMNQLKN